MSEIRNCKFSFKCPKNWESLEPTDNMHQRFCGECNQIVHLCDTPEDLMKAIQGDLCVAIANIPSNEGSYIVGRPAQQYGEGH
jgi:hypothetical protein